ncbi:MAG: PIG-L family deacetylase [Acidobacteria bacterium]|nr:PIG-L family deacetylase [Acidobacteriota bacterium]
MAEVLHEVPARALAVYAHPDDPEVSCGGTLATWSAAGCAVLVVVAAAGDKGSSDPGAVPAELARRRADETRAAAAVLGAEVELLGHLDGTLDAVAGLRGELVGCIRRWRPDAVVCPDPTAVFFGDAYVNHADHRAIGWAALDAVAPASSSPHYFPERGPAHQVSTVLLSGTLEPDVVIDVGGAIDAKVEALFRHASQLAPDAADWLGDFVRARAADEGKRAGVACAEAFRRLRLAR